MTDRRDNPETPARRPEAESPADRPVAVMAGLVPATHADPPRRRTACARAARVGEELTKGDGRDSRGDGRDKPGHDVSVVLADLARRVPS
jgi:hypothetical protein